MKTFVFNGWSAAADLWRDCDFPYDRLFDYLEQLDGAPEAALAAVDRAVLVGFSMGGTTALRMLLAHPGKVAGLVLVSATARMMEDRETGWKGMSLHRRAALKYGTMLTTEGLDSPLYDERNLDRGLDYLAEQDLRASLLAAAFERIPVEILQSEKDGIVRPSNAEFLKRVFPWAGVTLVPGAEHSLPASAPALVSAAVGRVARGVQKMV